MIRFIYRFPVNEKIFTIIPFENSPRKHIPFHFKFHISLVPIRSNWNSKEGKIIPSPFETLSNAIKRCFVRFSSNDFHARPYFQLLRSITKNSPSPLSPLSPM